ncbi:MAG TPA: MBL fold metallo-hydrolase [Bryobacteraceae bacterium]|nr:MBL fold metallo-hydrolase [Bryobacteraceae bacterium]
MRWIALLAVLSSATLLARPLEIFFIDTEGGKATLIVSPSGQSLLIDAGFTDQSGRDSDRILAAAKLAHVKKIDYVIVSHHHRDHEGGVPNLLERFDVGTFFDPGPTTYPTPDRTYKAYEAAMTKQHREVIKAGATIPLKGLDITVVTAGGAHIEKPGESDAFCNGIARKSDENVDNASSVGVVVELGKFRYADFADLTWNKQIELLCPENRVGKVDVYQTAGHGGTEPPKAMSAMSPRVIVMNNGARGGGSPVAWRAYKASPGLEDLWQLHFSVEGAEMANSPDTFIANVDDPCEGKYLRLTAEADGSFTMYNSRNKFTKTYAARR